jgi:phosphate transport system permease protein
MSVTTAAAAKSGRGGGADAAFTVAVYSAGSLVLVTLSAIIGGLLWGGFPAFQHFGPGFLFGTTWDLPHEIFSAGVAVYGTVVTAILAIVFAVPVSFGIAFYLTELAPDWLRRPVGIAIELLAGIPSIIYGMWGVVVVVPIVANYLVGTFDSLAEWGDKAQLPVVTGVLDWLADYADHGSSGKGLFTASLILGIMIVPFIAATMRDVFQTVPAIYKESAYGLGCTTWEVMRRVVLPYTRTSIVGGIMLGLGRALGETMAVTFVIGNANHINASIFANGNTIASLIALIFPSADPDSLQLHSLLALGFLLFVISFIVLAISRVLLRPRGGQA